MHEVPHAGQRVISGGVEPPTSFVSGRRAPAAPRDPQSSRQESNLPRPAYQTGTSPLGHGWKQAPCTGLEPVSAVRQTDRHTRCVTGHRARTEGVEPSAYGLEPHCSPRSTSLTIRASSGSRTRASTLGRWQAAVTSRTRRNRASQHSHELPESNRLLHLRKMALKPISKFVRCVRRARSPVPATGVEPVPPVLQTGARPLELHRNHFTVSSPGIEPGPRPPEGRVGPSHPEDISFSTPAWS